VSSVKLQSQKTTVCILHTLCNHEEVFVLKGEDALKMDVIDLCSCDDDWNNSDEFQYNGSDAVNGVNTNKKDGNQKSNHITPDRRKRCMKSSMEM